MEIRPDTYDCLVKTRASRAKIWDLNSKILDLIDHL
jgi:hypothetical protein